GEKPRLADGRGSHIQRWPAVVAGGLLLAEATPEAIVIAEVTTVSGEVLVVDGALVASADIAAPVVADIAAPVVADVVAPVVADVVAPAAAASALPSAATVATAAVASTLSSDSP